jgi:hypothetical protein
MAVNELSIFSVADCAAESWSPEVFSLYGDPETVISKLDKIEMNLPNRRVFMFTLETKDKAELSFYERTSKDRVSVSRWQGKPDDQFHNSVSKAIIDNKGVNCVGEQTKAIVKKFPQLKNEGDVAVPANGRAAFSHAIRNQGNEYLRTTVYLMC